ncbi:hypothetical protein AWZ03_010057 [Drosophila navojoa]|uniref:Uncharacterized protein n=1 Tax=Drosophila navojoa TaxID=7232 RepID=A0A484B4C0_DRONA|nr:hypothetical protein AWZ03_010057 [Drosophila navojoa]
MQVDRSMEVAGSQLKWVLDAGAALGNQQYLFATHSRPERSHSYFDDIAKKGKQKTKTSSKTNQSIGSDRIERCEEICSGSWDERVESESYSSIVKQSKRCKTWLRRHG